MKGKGKGKGWAGGTGSSLARRPPLPRRIWTVGEHHELWPCASVAARDLSCDGATSWLAVKALVLRIVAAMSPSIANKSWAQTEVFVGIDGLRDMTKVFRGSLMPGACRAGVRAVRLICVIARTSCSFVQGENPRVELDFLNSRSPEFVDIVSSGWPIFGLASEFINTGFTTELDMLTPDQSCKQLAVDAYYRFSKGSILQPEIFANFLKRHLLVRPSRFRLPPTPVRRFLAFSGRPNQVFGLCHPAVASAEIAAALAVLSPAVVGTEGGVGGGGAVEPANATTATRFIRSAEIRLRRWWARWSSQAELVPVAGRAGAGTQPPEEAPIRAARAVEQRIPEWLVIVQLRSLLPWPIYQMLQMVQDTLALSGDASADANIGSDFDEEAEASASGQEQKALETVVAAAEKALVSGSVGLGLDRLPSTHARPLLSKRPAFWEERRERLAHAVLGPQTGGRRAVLARASRPVQGATGEGRLLLTWDLGRGLNATGMLTRPVDHQKGVGAVAGLVVFQSGHEGMGYHLRPDAVFLDPDGYAAHFAELGFDVITLCMPLLGFNQYDDNPRPPVDDGLLYVSFHEVFKDEIWGSMSGGSANERKEGATALSYFVAPVLLALDWAEANLGHTHFAMAGCSGGGWTTVLSAALDPRISLSIAVPAPLPPHLIDALEWEPLDWEAKMNPPAVYRSCSFLCMFVLATIGGSEQQRNSVHVYHRDELHPLPSPNNVRGREFELRDYYEGLLPGILEAARGVVAPGEAVAAGLPSGAPLRIAVSPAQRHCGDWRDRTLLDEILRRWVAARLPGAHGMFDTWPLPSDARSMELHV